MARRYDSMEDRIIANSALSLVNFHNGTPCWEWTGKLKKSRNGSGRAYPSINLWIVGKGARNRPAHRVSLEVFKGVRMTKVHVAAHLCNNPFCVNPEHLKRTTQVE